MGNKHSLYKLRKVLSTAATNSAKLKLMQKQNSWGFQWHKCLHALRDAEVLVTPAKLQSRSIYRVGTCPNRHKYVWFQAFYMSKLTG